MRPARRSAGLRHRYHHRHVARLAPDSATRTSPFCLLCHHKAPHRAWEPTRSTPTMYADTDIPEPPTFNDDYAARSRPARPGQRMRIADDLNADDLKTDPPAGPAAARS